ncbi:alpha/beta hydrolase [Litoreibacter roseus]|uniref:Esterase/lipase superfamily enzyme n=1 Tax=Litoreibacter roseus TaxID=2601869 RepID=A0A6N6JDY4_9RHOB|nr:alpha/beta fold hydrolase [Litoreibacter roseus]GFE64541.1 hypothetical protein KIN_16150 [Litoreibacter roseus]
MRLATALLVLVALASCTPRGKIDFAQTPPSRSTTTQDIYYATTRDAAANFYGDERSETTQFGLISVSIPEAHRSGRIEWPRRERPDPDKHFLTVATDRYPRGTDLVAQLNSQLRQRPADDREITLFIHGFNTTFAESVYRMAQLSHDLGTSSVPVIYSWPSGENPLGYAYSRDSALIARDGLEDVIEVLTQTEASGIVLVTHSMGSLVAMETLRQMRGRKRDRAIDQMSVVMISPDIDVDVFRSQARAIGDLPDPFVVLGSQRDRVLRLAGRLTGQGGRVGTLDNIDRLSEFKITFIDVTAFDDADTQHFSPATSPALLEILNQAQEYDRALTRDPAARPGLLPGTALTVQNATRLVLTPNVR